MNKRESFELIQYYYISAVVLKLEFIRIFHLRKLRIRRKKTLFLARDRLIFNQKYALKSSYWVWERYELPIAGFTAEPRLKSNNCNRPTVTDSRRCRISSGPCMAHSYIEDYAQRIILFSREGKFLRHQGGSIEGTIELFLCCSRCLLI